jgi:hypothetical protein
MMHFELIDIQDDNFEIPAGVTDLLVDNCPLYVKR